MGIAWSASLYILLALAAGLLVTGLYAFVHCLRTRQDAFDAAGKWSKNIWLVILGIAVLLVCTFLYTGFTVLVIAAIGIILYLVDVRPKVDEVQRPRY